MFNFLQKTGWKHFITSHPNEFALVDDHVYLLQEPVIPRPMRQTQSSGGKKAVSSSSSGDNFTPPSKATITKISKFLSSVASCCIFVPWCSLKISWIKDALYVWIKL